ncbi:uncharacterized protein LOC132692629 isoform X2 [Panthera onca]
MKTECADQENLGRRSSWNPPASCSNLESLWSCCTPFVLKPLVTVILEILLDSMRFSLSREENGCPRNACRGGKLVKKLVRGYSLELASAC